jgi:hypothetical protein
LIIILPGGDEFGQRLIGDPENSFPHAGAGATQSFLTVDQRVPAFLDREPSLPNFVKMDAFDAGFSFALQARQQLLHEPGPTHGG